MIKDRGFGDLLYYRASRLKSTILSIQSISKPDLSYLGLDSWHFVTAGSDRPGKPKLPDENFKRHRNADPINTNSNALQSFKIIHLTLRTVEGQGRYRIPREARWRNNDTHDWAAVTPDSADIHLTQNCDSYFPTIHPL